MANEGRCQICSTHRRSLSSQVAQHSKRTCEVLLKSHANDRYLHSPELRVKLSLEERCKRNMQKKISRLQDILKAVTDKTGVLLDEADHNDFKELLIKQSGDIVKNYHKDSLSICLGSNS